MKNRAETRSPNLHDVRETDAKRRCFTVLAACAIACFAAACSPTPKPGPPNIILIIGDDHGWPYFGFMDDPIIATPHLDALARGGTLFPYAFVTSSTCRQSLLTLLTGLHPLQWNSRLRVLRTRGIRRGRYREIVDFVTLPRLLGEAGYRSFQGGKYWEGRYQNAGFDEGTKVSGATDPDPTEHGKMQSGAGGAGLELGRTTMKPLWEFLERADDRPFFVWFAPKLPHTPHDAAQSYLHRYSGRGLSPEAVKYYANITRFDDRVGELVAFLDRAGLRRNTLLVYLSDNGWQQGPNERPRIKSLGGPKGKGSMYELGVRTPLIFNWPGQIAAAEVRNDLVSSVDLFPTLLSFAGVPVPPNRSPHNLYPLLTGKGPPTEPRRTVMASSNRELRPPPSSEQKLPQPNQDIMRTEMAYTMRTKEWRYIWYFDSVDYPDRSADELFRIDTDPYEGRDVAAQHSDRVAEFRREILAWIDTATEPYQFRAGEDVSP
ncbi:MAG: sulfatase-like hydrolase/transferase [Myxococcota bacterium]